jgi:cytochrome c oxidase assembly protein subunit 15
MAITCLALVVLQGAFGAWTVTLRLEPVIVTTHLLLALLLLAVLTWQAARLAPPGAASGAPQGLRAFAGLALALLVVQIALGGWTSTNYAVLACSDFPRCQGQWVPPMDFEDGFTLLRALGHRPDGSFLPFPALVAIHWTHRNMAALVGTALLGLAFWLWRATLLRAEAVRLALLVVLQIATGLANVLFGWPLLAAVLHNAGAAALVVMLVLINYRLRFAPGAAGAAHRPSAFALS